METYSKVETGNIVVDERVGEVVKAEIEVVNTYINDFLLVYRCDERPQRRWDEGHSWDRYALHEDGNLFFDIAHTIYSLTEEKYVNDHSTAKTYFCSLAKKSYLVK